MTSEFSSHHNDANSPWTLPPGLVPPVLSPEAPVITRDDEPEEYPEQNTPEPTSATEPIAEINPVENNERQEAPTQTPQTVGAAAMSGATQPVREFQKDVREAVTASDTAAEFTTVSPEDSEIAVPVEDLLDRPTSAETLQILNETAVSEFREAENPRRREDFDRKLLDEKQVNITGNEHPEVVDLAAYQMVAGHAEKLGHTGGGVVLSVRFRPPKETVITHPIGPPLYTPVPMKVTGPNSLFQHLNSDQAADALAATLAGEDDKMFDGYRTILGPTIAKLQEISRDPITGETTMPSLAEIAEAIGVHREKRVGPPYNEIVHLGEPARTAVGDALGAGVLKNVSSLFEPLGAGLDTLVRDTASSGSRDAATEPPPPVTRDHLANGVGVVHVTVDGYGRRMTGESRLAVNSILPYIAEPTELGKVQVLHVSEAEHAAKADMRAWEEVMDYCRSHGVKVILSVSKVSEQTAALVQGGAHIVAHGDALEREFVSKVVGTEPGELVNSVSGNKSGNVGSGDHDSFNKGWKAGDPLDSGGRTQSTDGTRGLAFSVTENITVGDVPIATPGELGTLGATEAAVFDSQGKSLGRFSVTTRRPMGSFPPPRRQPSLTEEAKEQIATIEYQHRIAVTSHDYRMGKQPGEDKPNALEAGSRRPYDHEGEVVDEVSVRVTGPASDDVLADMSRQVSEVAGPPAVQHPMTEARIQYFQETRKPAKGAAFRTWAENWAKERGIELDFRRRYHQS